MTNGATENTGMTTAEHWNDYL